jgi:uncharacterized repeat protein (TIGR01451 family)
MSDLSPADLAGIDVLFVQNPSNGAYGAEYLSRLNDVNAAVAGGLILILHDRFVTDATKVQSGGGRVLPGSSGFTVVRNFDSPERNDIEIRDSSTVVTDNLTATSLDNGDFSCHGYIESDTLPPGAKKFLNRGDPGDPDPTIPYNQVVTSSYTHGSGTVIYSTIPLDQFLANPSPEPNSSFATIYAPNVIEYAGVLSLHIPDLAVSLDNGQTVSVPGDTVTYTLVVSNLGPGEVLGATVTQGAPAELSNVTWSCSGADGATCPSAGGSGAISETVDMPSGSTLTYTTTADIDPSTTGDLTVSATVAQPGGDPDPFPANNSASDVDTLTPIADVAVTKSGPGRVNPGEDLEYTLTCPTPDPRLRPRSSSAT